MRATQIGGPHATVAMPQSGQLAVDERDGGASDDTLHGDRHATAAVVLDLAARRATGRVGDAVVVLDDRRQAGAPGVHGLRRRARSVAGEPGGGGRVDVLAVRLQRAGARLLASGHQVRHKNRGQDTDDGDYDEEFNQSEAA